MPARLRPAGMLKSYVGDQAEVEVEPGRTVRQTLSDLGIPPELVALVVVNDSQQNKEYCLQEGDLVKVLAVIGGG